MDFELFYVYLITHKQAHLHPEAGRQEGERQASCGAAKNLLAPSPNSNNNSQTHLRELHFNYSGIDRVDFQRFRRSQKVGEWWWHHHHVQQ